MLVISLCKRQDVLPFAVKAQLKMTIKERPCFPTNCPFPEEVALVNNSDLQSPSGKNTKIHLRIAADD